MLYMQQHADYWVLFVIISHKPIQKQKLRIFSPICHKPLPVCAQIASVAQSPIADLMRGFSTRYAEMLKKYKVSENSHHRQSLSGKQKRYVIVLFFHSSTETLGIFQCFAGSSFHQLTHSPP